MHTSPITRDRIAESAAPMPRQDSQDFDDAERGFIARRVERTITNAEHRGAVGDELLPARRQWIGWAERNAVEEDYPTFIVRGLGWADTEPMPPRAQLKAYASYLMGEGIVWGGGITTEGGLTWVNDGNDFDRYGVRGVIKAFRNVNKEEIRTQAEATWQRARTTAGDGDRVDVHRGIADIERFLDDR